MLKQLWSKIKRVLIGKPLKNEDLEDEKMNVLWGLPILSSDAISSVAYAGEEILWVLIPIIGLLSYKYMFFTALGIVGLLLLLVFSYRQTIDHYPNGGGAYIVAKDNLGPKFGLVAGASLIIDYILTVAVSATAATAALTSALPGLFHYKVEITIGVIILLTIGNLRGVRESSKIFGLPTYLFLGSVLFMIVYGIFKVTVLGVAPAAVTEIPNATGSISIFLILRAFAAGCTALTGVEAVSNGIPNFTAPAQKNAKIVLGLLAAIVLFMFGGTSYLATLYHAVPNHEVTVISQIANQVFDGGFMYYVVQLMTMLILAMAANTAFAGLPLLLSLVSRDGYMPRQFTERGERLGYSNGIKMLSLAAIVLVILFHGETHALLPLYAIGVFVSFTLSQSGMVIRQYKVKQSGWQYKILINGVGAIITFITVIVISVTKFTVGAWIIFIVIPIFVSIMLKTKKHYFDLANILKLSPDEVEAEMDLIEVKKYAVVLVDTLNKASLKAISYATDVFGQYYVIAFHVATTPEDEAKIRQKWEACGMTVPLVVKYSPYREIIRPLTEYLESAESESKPGDMLTIVMPEFIVSGWENVYHNRTASAIRKQLLHDRHVGVITVPYVINEDEIV